jgi:tRNA(His) 5'-end guanylyltransferase
MPVRDDLGTRMKEFYEQVPKFRLYRRTPVAIRIDGKAFHTFTRGFQKPFDEVLIKSMQETMKYLCENIQGCVLGYTQSDEITLILVDYKKLNSDAWFDYEIQKICSIAASMATMAFNRSFRYNAEIEMVFTKDEKYKETLLNAIVKGAMFDARCFNIPREEVTNLIYWRQLDATRNSIQMVGQANFSHKELQNKSCNDIQDMLMLQKDINWNDFPTHQKRGSCCVRKVVNVTTKDIYEEQEWGEPIQKTMVTAHYDWVIDTEIPIFKGEGREYIECLIQPEEE